MAKGNTILISTDPRGRKTEGYITGTPKPGIMLMLDVSEAERGGRFTWEPFNRTFDAQMGLVAVLLEDELQGVNNDTAYVTGARCFLYFPLPGDELNMLFQNQAGTADDVAFGDYFVVDDGTGKMLATTGTAADKSEPFQALEVVTDPTEDTLVHCYFTGY